MDRFIRLILVHFLGEKILLFPLLFLPLPLWGCVGPTTPFGAIHHLGIFSSVKVNLIPHNQNQATPPEKSQQNSSAKDLDPHGFYAPIPSPPKISFFPDRQVLHDRRDFKVVIFDPKGISENSRWRVYYNGYDVTSQFVPSANKTESSQHREWTLEFKNLRLRPEKDNFIQLAYFSNPNQKPTVQSWLPPECPLREIQPVVTTETFTPSSSLIKKIDQWSKQHQVNPSLITGLVAQESGFNPHAVSWAKAIGLTQVTPLGDLEISRVQPDWPRANSISRFPAAVVKTLISTGHLTAKDDWRLNPELSIRGGLTMIDYLLGYWENEPLLKQLTQSSSQASQLKTNVILASYQAGAARVKKALNERQQNFLRADYLSQARKYVRRVNSYCYHFSQNEDLYAKSP